MTIARAHLAVCCVSLLPVLSGAAPLFAQAVDTTLVLGTIAEFDAHCEDIGRQLWGRPLCGPIVFVHAPTRAAIASAPDPGGSFVAGQGAWFGTLPADMPVANTALDWDGEHWTMVLLPLSADRFARLRLVAHEAFHRVQAELGLEARDAVNPHLDERAGRVWLRLELRALSAALLSDGDDALRAVTDALSFRAERYRLFAGADTLEALLERHEGLPEYTGTRYALAVTNAGVERVVESLRAFERRPSYVRALGYATGPALGLLLDRYRPDWRQFAGEQALASLLAMAVGLAPAALAAAEERPSLDARAGRYGFPELAAEEEARAAAAAARLADIHIRLVAGPVVLLRHERMRGSFNPNEVVPVPGEGTYHPTGAFEAEWGRLEVREGGVLVGDGWQWLRVPAANVATAADERTVTGAGWQLQLAEGWELRPLPAAGGWQVTRRR